ncbi:hypothetical protein [Aneurinibacillus uraniidurans]|uniref:hypothetical protein n=1 Tax=Aneurinibacillus uraniidurans TaxID=2966586 RepID=UPI00234981D5|nr:hypothetical protein [Aneurinibacillus sp. B1]WCN39572.1 hypothetical protein PO771_09295 [Aneurinibacillus sp. B1]
METNNYLCKCGMYTYHCECVPENQTTHYNELIHRLRDKADVVLGAEELPVVLRMLPTDETRLIIAPLNNGYYTAHIATPAPV